MDQQEFKNQYLGSFNIGKKEQELWELAKFYHDECDRHDETFCTGKSKSREAMPINSYERGRSYKNAQKMKEYCVNLGKDKGYSKEEILKALSDYMKNH